MKLYFAPLEGITGYVYRNLHNKMFGGCDEYFAPFIVPADNERITQKSLKDILPENNGSLSLRVQVLTNNSNAFLRLEKNITDLGYNRVNINLGCPSGTVVSKGRGAGFLKDVDGMDRFFYEIFEKTKLDISVKTRIGFYDEKELDDIFTVYNKYPFSEIIVHPRVREAYYKGEVDVKAFDFTYKNSRVPICYNGDVKTVADYNKIIEKYPNLSGVMIGRGGVCRPWLFSEIKGNYEADMCKAIDFTVELMEEYGKILESETFTLHKIKEVWTYMLLNYPENKKVAKALKKAKSKIDFLNALKGL